MPPPPGSEPQHRKKGGNPAKTTQFCVYTDGVIPRPSRVAHWYCVFIPIFFLTFRRNTDPTQNRPTTKQDRKTPMAIDEILVATGHGHRHGDEKICKRAWRGTNEAYSRCRCSVSLVMRLVGWVYPFKGTNSNQSKEIHSPVALAQNHRRWARGTFFCPPMPGPGEGPSRTAPLGGHLANCGLPDRNAAGGVAPQAPVRERPITFATMCSTGAQAASASDNGTAAVPTARQGAPPRVDG
jgi:hypothetical protein